MDEKRVTYVGWFASIMATTMYVSYIDQIMLNMAGNPGSVILPIVTTINCLSWGAYGFLKTKKDWPIIVCNIPGVVLGIITAATALMYA
jgi:uncharacterized protein with PQ loop repeat